MPLPDVPVQYPFGDDTGSLVEQVPRRGVFVRQPGPVELMEMFEVMAELEASCARLAAMRITDEGLDDLRATNLRCQRAVEERDAARPDATRLSTGA